ncbi:hypothetical protein ACOSQ2_021025 [Xanthoceras sorbifolium]
MGKFNLNFSLIFLFSLFTFCNLTATCTDQLTANANPIEGVACSLINCGQGRCVSSNASLVGVDCECNPGWKKIQIGALTFPSCIIPNCTVNFNCSNESPPPLPPPAAVIPPLNLSDPCALVWCGDGSCAPSENGHACHCFPGSENLFGNSAYVCLKQCNLGGDCKGLGLGLPGPPPPPTKSGSASTGPNPASNSSSKLGILTITLLVAATIQTWF